MSQSDYLPVTTEVLRGIREAFKNPGVMIEPATDRETFCAMLYTHPLLHADTIVVLCGEDMAPRLAMAVQLWHAGAAAGILLTGGRHAPLRWMGADDARLDLVAKGVAPDRIMTDTASTNTREQAANVTALASEHGWTRLLLVASSYHMPRAVLTFVATLPETVRVIPATAVAHWNAAPEAMRETRAELLDAEFSKIEEYAGHVASYADGIAHFTRWERR